MSDSIGRIPVPAIAPSGTFPLAPDFGWVRPIAPGVVAHAFGAGNLKREQRFYFGNGVRQWRVGFSHMSESRRESLINFWETNRGGYGTFTFNAPSDDGLSTTATTCRFWDPVLAIEHLLDAVSRSGVVLAEIPDDAAAPSYSLVSTVTRFPSAALASGLLGQTQEIIPLIKIQPLEAGHPAIFLSDRRCTVGGQIYLARLVEFDGISQSIDNHADQARFVFGNADRVMSDLANDVDLFRSAVEFSLFHVATGIKADIWRGDMVDWSFDSGPEFRVTATDGVYELNLPYPTRRISRSCWKDFNDGVNCPYGSVGAGGDAFFCDKGFATRDGCQAHGMAIYFGGIEVRPQAVRLKDNSTGFWGYGRSPLTAVSLVSETIYNEVVPEIYTDHDMPVNAKIAAGRDEGEFYAALGVVGEGPLGAFAAQNFTATPQVAPHLLDSAPPHGAVSKPPRNNYGWRSSLGSDPNAEPFSLGEGGAGVQRYGPQRAAGTAFFEIRREDAKGIQPTKLGDHHMKIVVAEGLSGWVWGAPGSRSSAVLINPVWIAVNMLLRARGLKNAAAIEQEKHFDVRAAINAAAICDQSVTSLVPDANGLFATEPQFAFRGIVQEEKPLRDWLSEILLNCLGYFTFSFGKLRIGIRSNSSAAEAFDDGNMIFGSLALSPARPTFNHIIANFANEAPDFQFGNDVVALYDIDNAKLIGGRTSPLYLKSQINFSGVTTRSQALRLIHTRLKEELGGIDATQWKNARDLSFKTTVLALAVDPGAVCRIDHADMPGGSGEFRVSGWRLNRDWSIDITGRTTTDEMYSSIAGPKPADVAPNEPPAENSGVPANWSFQVSSEGNGAFGLDSFQCKTNGANAHRFLGEVYYVDEARAAYSVLTSDIDKAQTAISYAGEPPVAGNWILVDSEVMGVVDAAPTAPNFGTATVRRGQFGTPAADHRRITTTVVAVDISPAELTVGAGLGLRPGMGIVTPTSEGGFIGSYAPIDGKLVLLLPLGGAITAGDRVYSDPRIWRIQRRNVEFVFPQRFFRSGNRATWQHVVNDPDWTSSIGVVLVRGVLQTAQGLASEPYIFTLAANWPNRLRTLGPDPLIFQAEGLKKGTNDDAFETAFLPTPRAWSGAWADVLTGRGEVPIEAPPAPDAIVPSDLRPGGTISIGGSITAAGRIGVTIGNGLDQFVQPPVFSVTTETTPVHVADALARWLNETEEFAAFFSAAVTAGVVEITDHVGTGGQILVETYGGVTAIATGLARILGITSGRRYALSFFGGALESSLSPLSASTGPLGGHGRIEIKALPSSTDTRVDTVNVYAAPDGEWGPFYRVAQIVNGVREAVDSTTESALVGLSRYGGAKQPTAPGRVRFAFRRDGDTWFELRVKTDEHRSNVIDGLAISPGAAGTRITCDVVTSSDGVNVRAALE